MRHCPPFGHAALPAAPVGFAVASPTLRLAEGARQLTLVLQLAGLQVRHSATALAASFQALLSGPKGWIGPLPVTAALQGDALSLGLTLAAAQPAVVDHDPALHLQRFAAGVPVLQLLLKPDAPLAFGAFDGVSLRSAQLLVAVQGLRGLTLEADAGTLDAKKAFLPFGPQPVAGSRLLIGCEEALSKRLTALELKLRWHGAPDDLLAWYAGYRHRARLSNGVSATLTWQDASGASRSTPPLDLMQRTAGVTTLGPAVAPVGPAWSAGGRVHALHTGGALAVRGLARREVLRHPARASAITVAPAVPRAGFMTLTLLEDFLHGDFRSEAIKHLIAADGVVLNEPYTPKAQEIWLDYRAQTDVSRLDTPDAAAFTDTELQFFHVDAFGSSREHAWLQALRPWGPQAALPLLPAHPDAGELLIGLAGLRAGDSVSLLLQAAEGSADPQATPQTLSWSVLADNAWRVLAPGELALDSTRELRRSGLVVAALPRETSTEHTRLDPDLVWLRAGNPAAPRAACDLVGVHANAVEVEFVDQRNDPARLAHALPAKSIAKLKTPLAGVKAVSQPYASFGGALRETDAALARRAAERLRHRGRAIAGWDAERLVLQAFPGVYRAKCIPHASPDSWLAAGHAMLVVLPDLRQRNAADLLQPRVDLDTLQRIHALLVERGGLGVQWHVRNPGYRRVRLDFKLRVRAGFAFNHYRGQLNRALVERLSPWAHDAVAGPDFGGRVLRSALLDFVEAQPYVDYVTDFHLFAGDDPRDVAEALADAPDTILVSAPEHRIAQETGDA